MDWGTLVLKGFRQERGLLWPDYDRRCAEVTFGETETALPRIMGHISKRRVAVQAGGNCGQLVRGLAGLFDAVYTFEPDRRNFVALTVNTAGAGNVFRYQAALGNERGLHGLAQGDLKHPANCGAWYVNGRGAIPTLRVDDLGLSVCDALLLDIEGAELQAIMGAEETIKSSRPVIVVEDKGLGERHFGEARGDLAAHLQWLGYRLAERIKNDWIWTAQ